MERGCFPWDLRVDEWWKLVKATELPTEQYGQVDCKSGAVVSLIDSKCEDCMPYVSALALGSNVPFHTHPPKAGHVRPPSAADLFMALQQSYEANRVVTSWVLEKSPDGAGTNVYVYRPFLEAVQQYKTELDSLATTDPSMYTYLTKTHVLRQKTIDEWQVELDDIFSDETKAKYGRSKDGYKRAVTETFAKLKFTVILLFVAPIKTVPFLQTSSPTKKQPSPTNLNAIFRTAPF